MTKPGSRLPAGAWRTSETETRIAIKAGRKTIAYVQMSGMAVVLDFEPQRPLL